MCEHKNATSKQKPLISFEQNIESMYSNLVLAALQTNGRNAVNLEN